LRTNVLGGINLVGLARQLGASILQASTRRGLGDPAVAPQTEGYWGNVNPNGREPVTPRASDALKPCYVIIRGNMGSTLKVARLLKAYGATMAINDGRVVSGFIIQALQNVDLTVYGAGDQGRGFC